MTKKQHYIFIYLSIFFICSKTIYDCSTFNTYLLGMVEIPYYKSSNRALLIIIRVIRPFKEKLQVIYSDKFRINKYF